MSGVVRIIRPKPSGSVTITENNTTVDVSKFAEALVQVPVEKGIAEATTDTEMQTFVDESEGGEIVKFTGTSSTYEKGRLYIVKSENKEISFTVNGKSYQALDGMTWAEWVESDYRGTVYLWYVSGSNIECDSVNYHYIIDNVTPTDVIVANANYTVTDLGGGGAGN